MLDFTTQLKADMVEQFKEQPNIDALLETVGEQLQAVADFYADLRSLRTLQAAAGKQLDGAGDIVVLTRAEAGKLASISDPGAAVTDEVYRKFLIYKVLKNTNTCTYGDIIKSFKMFWSKPLHYSEDPEQPATMIFKTDALAPGDQPEKLLSAPIIRAAGVGVKIYAITETPELSGNIHIGSVLGRGYTITKLPEIEPDYNFSHTDRYIATATNVSTTRLPELKEGTA